MSNHISLEAIDTDGALREAAEEVGANRRDFLRKGAIAGGGFVAGGVLFNGMISPAEAAISTRKKSKKNDVKILNYALTLEFLEAAFYKEAFDNKVAQGEPLTQKFVQVVADHEADHVTYLRKALGKSAVKKPKFDFGKATTDLGTFKTTAQVLEDTGVSAYAGQGPNIYQRPVVKAALSIHSVEARHAAWIRFLNGGGEAAAKRSSLPAPRTFDRAASAGAVLRAVSATSFIR